MTRLEEALVNLDKAYAILQEEHAVEECAKLAQVIEEVDDLVLADTIDIYEDDNEVWMFDPGYVYDLTHGPDYADYEYDYDYYEYLTDMERGQ